MTGPYVIGCDVGSQGTNAALYAADGRLVASAYEAYDVSFPHPTWAEQDPRVWTTALEAAIPRLLAQVPEGPSAVKGLSFGSQLDGMVVCDAKGAPLRPAMIWMDRRAEPQAATVAAKLPPADFYHHTGANLDSSHAVFKALWVRDEEPEVFAEAVHLMPPGSYVLREAAGVLAVDWSNASSLALLDPRTRTWSAPVLDAVGIDPAILPELAPGTRAVGPVTPAFAERTGLHPDTVVVVGCGDEMRPPWGRACSPPVRSATWSAPPSRSAPPRRDRARTRRCWWNATPTPTRTSGCWRTRGSCPGGTSAGGGTSSRPWSATPRPAGRATPTTC